MDKRRTVTKRNRGVRTVFGIAAIIITLFVVSLFGFAFIIPARQVSRVTVVIAASPMVIWSWDKKEEAVTIVTIPSDVVIDGIHGYGPYTVEALWKLGAIDKKDGALLSESLGESLGFPIPWYIGPREDSLPSELTPDKISKKIFTPGNLLSYRRTYRSNIPIPVFWAVSNALRFIRSDKVTFLDFANRSDVKIREVLPDGTSRFLLDPKRTDVLLESAFEDDRVRKEGLTVSVYNTTKTPTLASKVARMVTHMGAQVVSVSNDEHAVGRCIVSGKKEILDSVTVSVISEIFDCVKEEESTDREDIIVRIGKKYEEKFFLKR